MMKCKYCKSEIENDAQFCPICGKKVSRENLCVKCGEELEDGAEFCSYCGTRQRPQTPISTPKGNVKRDISKKKDNGFLSKPWVILLMIALLFLFIYLLFFNTHGNKTKHDGIEQEEMASEERSNLVEKDSVTWADTVNVNKQQEKEDSLMKVAKQKSDSLVYLKDSLNNKGKGKRSSKNLVVKSGSSSRGKASSISHTVERSNVTIQTGIKNLGYGSYEGFLVSGKPHGVNGRLTFKTSHLIDSRDPKGRIAEPGDYVIGEFYEGHLVQGIWYDMYNQVKGSIIIGR